MLKLQGETKTALKVLQTYLTEHPDNLAVKALISEYMLEGETEKHVQIIISYLKNTRTMLFY